MTFEGFENDTWEALPGARRLTMAQREAIESDEPLLCVVAGAGAGKTRVLTLRVARRVREGTIEADRTLVTTFSRKAAEELRTRLWSLGVAGVKAGTFHRTALGLLREHRELRGRPAPQLMTDRRRLLADVTNGDARRTRALDSEIGWAKARLVSPDHYEDEARRHRRRSGLRPEQVAEAYTRYETERSRRRLLDFDDLIVACADALAGDAEFAASIRWRTRHLFVDEMQDVNPAQFRLLTAMLADEPDLFVVGDPNQSVYGFNGADPTLLDRLPELLRGTKVIRLDENHRCTPQVVAVATAVLQDGGSSSGGGEVVPPRTTRVDGPVPQVIAHPTDDDEAVWAATRAKMSRTPGRRWSSIAVLTRTNAQLVAVKAAMDAALVPSRVAGSDLGPASDLRAEADRDSAERIPSSRTGRGATGVDADDVLDDRNTSFVDDPATQDHVVLTTFHRAKGLQWPTVLVLGLGAGLMPIASAQTEAAIDEERRLLYVALTRSEDELYCSWFERAGDDLGGLARKPSPWLAPIEETVARLEKEAAPTSASEVSARVAELRQRLVDGSEGADVTR
jgi:DNA helicase-2/ATP-dependent DNA helicase PcrA